MAAYKNADIPRAMLTEHYVFICELHVLPVLQDKFEYYNVDTIFSATSQNQKWYNNDEAVGKIRFVYLYSMDINWLLQIIKRAIKRISHLGEKIIELLREKPILTEHTSII